MQLLSVDGIATNDLDFVENMRGLTLLSAVNCGVDDVFALRNLELLETLYLDNNNIKVYQL